MAYSRESTKKIATPGNIHVFDLDAMSCTQISHRKPRVRVVVIYHNSPNTCTAHRASERLTRLHTLLHKYRHACPMLFSHQRNSMERAQIHISVGFT